MPELDARKREILRLIIDDYVLTAEPIGSEAVSAHHRLGVSPATVRNEMAELEELGYLRQPHTSAGRVPTEQAYRVYVDSMLGEEHLPSWERARLRRTLFGVQPERSVEQAAHALASVTNFAAVAASVTTGETRIRHLQLVPLTPRRALVVAVTDEGVFEGTTAEFATPIPPDDLDRLSHEISRRIGGMSLHDLTPRTLDAVIGDAARHQRVVDEVARLLREHLLTQTPGPVYSEGKANILKQPEFQDVRRAQPVLSALEQRDVVVELLRPGSEEARVRITIGRENKREEMKECSVITATYFVGDRPAGVVGIVGPTRMQYGKVISLLSFLADSLAEAIGQA
ncbi:MAG TPA: heat-inducible transcriptional repressor HrcA [bacterium]